MCKRMEKKALGSLVLAAALLLVACTPAQSTPQAQQPEVAGTAGGGTLYLRETNITPEGSNPHSLVVWAEDDIAVMDADYATRWRTGADGLGSWQATTGWLANATGIQDVIAAEFIDADTLLVWAGLADGSRRPLLLPQNGEWSEFPLEGLETALEKSERPYAEVIGLVDDASVLLSYHWPDDEALSGYANSTAVYSIATGEMLYRLDMGGEEAVAAAAAGGFVYTLDMYGNVYAFESSTGRPVAEKSFAIPYAGLNTCLSALAGGVYIANTDRIAWAEDDTAQEVVSGPAYAFGGAEAEVRCFAALASGGFLVCTTGTSGQLYLYTPLEGGAQATLRIFALEASPTVAEAINVFRRANPEVQVEFETPDWAAGLPYDDVLTQLNTQILGGTGPDILMLDGMPLQSYARQGLLLDLAPLVDTADVYPNLLQGVAEGECLYYLPTGLQVYAIMAPEGEAIPGDITKLTDMLLAQDIDFAQVELGDASAQLSLPAGVQPVLWFDNYIGLFMDLWYTSGATVVQGDALNSALLRDIFETQLAICQKLHIMGQDTARSHSYGSMVGEYMFSASYNMQAYTFLNGQTSYGIAQFTSMGDVLLLQVAHKMGMPVANVQLAPVPGFTAGAWQPMGMLGVNATSSQPALALDFVQTALSADVQGSLPAQGSFPQTLPVTQAGGEIQFNKLADLMREGFDAEELQPVNTYTPLVAQLQTPYLLDNFITNTVWAAAMELSKGEISVDEAVARVEQDLQLYLAEKN